MITSPIIIVFLFAVTIIAHIAWNQYEKRMIIDRWLDDKQQTVESQRARISELLALFAEMKNNVNTTDKVHQEVLATLSRLMNIAQQSSVSHSEDTDCIKANDQQE